MSFLALIIALSLNQVIRPGSAIQRDSWLLRWEQQVSASLGASVLTLLLTLLVPLLVVLWVLATVDSWLFGLLELLGVAALLLWSLGREDYHTALECFVARQSGHLHGNDVAERLWAPTGDEDGRDGFDESSPKTGSADKTEDSEPVSGYESEEENAEFASADWEREQDVLGLVYCGYERWFAPVFYFVLLGIFGALLYRAVSILARSDRDARYLTVLAVLDWLPSRILCLTFALAGDFLAVTQSRVMQRWMSTTSAAELLATAAGVACASGSARAIGDVLYRSSGFWLLVVSVIAILA